MADEKKPWERGLKVEGVQPREPTEEESTEKKPWEQGLEVVTESLKKKEDTSVQLEEELPTGTEKLPPPSLTEEFLRVFENMPLIGSIIKEKLQLDSSTLESESTKSDFTKTPQKDEDEISVTVSKGTLPRSSEITQAATDARRQEKIKEVLNKKEEAEEYAKRLSENVSRAVRDITSTVNQIEKEAATIGYSVTAGGKTITAPQTITPEMMEMPGVREKVATVQKQIEDSGPLIDTYNKWTQLLEQQEEAIKNIDADITQLGLKKEVSYTEGPAKAFLTSLTDIYSGLAGASNMVADLTGSQSAWVTGFLLDRAAKGIKEDWADPLHDAPDNFIGNVLTGTAGIVPQLLFADVFPLIGVGARLEALTGGLVKTIPKFGLATATEEAGITYLDTSDPLEALEAAGRGFAEGSIMHALGYVGGKSGAKFAEKLGTGKIAEEIIKANTVGATFTAWEFLNGEVDLKKLSETYGIGLAFGFRDIAKSLRDGAIEKFVSSSPEIIKEANDIEMPVRQMREKVAELSEKFATEKNVETKKQLLLAIKALNGIADVKAITEEIVLDPTSKINDINNDPAYSAETKTYLVDLIKRVSAENDPRAKEARPLNDQIERLRADIETVNSNEYKTDLEKKAEITEAESQIGELETQVAEIYKPKTRKDATQDKLRDENLRDEKIPIIETGEKIKPEKRPDESKEEAEKRLKGEAEKELPEVAAKKEVTEEVTKKIVEPEKVKPDDKKDIERLPSEVEKREEPVKEEPFKEPSKEEVGPSRVFQKQEKITVKGKDYKTEQTEEGISFIDDAGKTVSERHPSGGKNKKHAELLEEYKKDIDFDQGERADLSDIAESKDLRQIEETTIERSSNPAELVEAFARNIDNRKAVELSAKEEVMRDYLFTVDRDSYLRFGDRKTIGQQIGKSWLKKGEQTIDQAAQELSGYGLEITPQDIVDYINRFPSGSLSSRKVLGESPISNMAAEKFREITGFDLSEKIAEEILKKQSDKLNLKENERYIEELTDAELEQLAAERDLSESEAAKIYEQKIPRIEAEGKRIEVAKEEVRPKLKAAVEKEKKVEPEKPVEKKPEEKKEPTKVTKKTPATIQDAQTMYSDRKITLNELQEHLERIRKETPRGEMSQTQKSYEDIAGLTPRTQTGRVPVKPIVRGSPKAIKDIIFDVTKKMKQRLLFVKPSKRRALGTYSPGNSAVKIKFNGDLDTTAHELGHSIDDHFGVLSDMKENPIPAVDAELKKFSPFGSKAPQGHPDPKLYERAEGFAEFLRALIVNPEVAKIEAPELFKLYEEKVSESYKNSIDQFSEDIRTFAGSSGRDMTLSNIEFKPKEAEGVIKQIFKNRDTNNQFSISWVDKLAANYTDPLQAFNKAWEYAKGIKGIDEVLPADNPIIGSRLLLGADGKYGEILKHGMIDGKNKLLRDSKGNPKDLKWLLEPLDNADIATIEKDVKDVVSYMVAERTTELASRFGPKIALTGIGAGLFKDIDVAKKTLEEFNIGDPKRFSRIKKAASRYREFSDDILKYMVSKGRMSKEAYDAIKKDNLYYVGLKRVMETDSNGEISGVFMKSSGALGAKGEPIQRIKGSTKQIVNPYVSLIDTLYRVIKESDRNDVLRSFRDMVYQERGMYEGKPSRLADIGVLGQKGDKNSITIFIDGKPEHWIFQEDIYKSLKQLDSEAYRVPAVIRAFPAALRWTVTNWPIFGVRNVVRDFPDRLIKTEDKSGFRDLFGDKEHWRELARSGGLNSGYYLRDRASYYGLLENAMGELAKKKNVLLLDPRKLKNVWKGYQNILSKSETLNRVAEYRAAFRQAKKKSMDDYNASLYAGYKSRDLMDFALMGHHMKVINQIVPFSNASIQGLRKAVASARKNPAGFLARMVLYTVIPEIALWLINHSDEETAREYENLPAYQRDMAYNFKIGPNLWGIIPKPYELSLLGAGVSRGLSQFVHGNKEAFKGYGGSVAKSIFPVDEGNVSGPFQGIVEGIANYDFWREKTIVPPYQNVTDLALRNTENASRFGKALQEVAGIDARKIDHFIKSQFSYVGSFALKLFNIGAEKGPKFSITDFGFFKETPGYNSPKVQELLEYSERWRLGRSPTMKDFHRLSHEYFDEEDDKKKEEKAKILIDFADKALTQWKEQNISEEKIRKHEEKIEGKKEVKEVEAPSRALRKRQSDGKSRKGQLRTR